MSDSAIASRLKEIGRVFADAAESGYAQSIAAAAQAIGDALARGNKLLIFGNGGSAADAQHICGELVVRFERDRRPLPAIALTCDASVLTACANDYAYTEVFARQIEALGVAGDVALGISTSGTSTNVIRGFKVAKSHGMVTILITGPGRSSNSCDLVLAAPGCNTARVQELHLATYHLICEILDARFS
ncbi:MAG: SIS domain-containing protein [Bryobacterales bacterium]|nr:SIS domain-containing protein [Bryobacterales bacterium]